MNARTWNLKLTATEDHPEMTLEGVSNDDAAKLLRGLMHGPGSSDYAHVQEAVAIAGVRTDRHEDLLAA